MVRVPVVRAEADRLLLGGRWHPVTERLTFFAGESAGVVAEFDAWRGAGQLRKTGCPLRIETVTGDLEQLLTRLVPLQSIQDRRFLFVPVATDGPYRTALFGNKASGSDTGFIQAGLAARGIGAVQVRSCPNDLRDEVWPGGSQGIHDLGVVWPAAGEADTRGVGFDGRLVGIRVGDSGRWVFVDQGDPLPFEDTTAYTAPRVRNRVTQQTLIDYAAALGLRPFDADFYAPNRTATLVSYTSPNYYGSRLISLAEAQGPPLEVVGVPDPDAVTERPPDTPTKVTWIRPDGTHVDQS